MGDVGYVEEMREIAWARARVGRTRCTDMNAMGEMCEMHGRGETHAMYRRGDREPDRRDGWRNRTPARAHRQEASR